MSILLVTHCYAEELPHYAGALQYQLSSLVLHPPRTLTNVVVCYTESDRATEKVMDWFDYCYGNDIQLIRMSMSKGYLFRRSIGRNLAALESNEDLIWFTDVDHYFGEGCLDSLCSEYSSLRDLPTLVWPKKLMIHRDHDESQGRLQECNLDDLKPVGIDPDEFVPKKYYRAIGGVQIANGEFCRRYGYIKSNRKYQTPRTDGKPFADFRDDLAFRKECFQHGTCYSLDIPNLYRLRHNQTTYQ